MEKTRRSLREISHLFLSELGRERLILPCLSFVGAEEECSFSWNSFFTHSILPELERVFVVDFHPPLLAWSAAPSRSFAPHVQPVVFPPDEIDFSFESLSDRRTHSAAQEVRMRRSAVLWDLPWHRLDLLDSVIRFIDHLIFVAEPTFSSLKRLYRLVKACQKVRGNHPVFLIIHSGTDADHETRFLSEFSSLCEGFLGMKPQYLGTVRRKDSVPFVLPTSFWDQILDTPAPDETQKEKFGLFDWLIQTTQSSAHDPETGIFLRGVPLAQRNGWKRTKSFPRPHFFERGSLEPQEIQSILDLSLASL